jgi:uncharacterized LabA/DUF88 family protein
MTMAKEAKIGLFIDFENIALGLKKAELGAFNVQRVIDRLLDKGRIIVKRAYADWKRYGDHTTALHEAGIELIQIPQRRLSGKNSADIRLVVDALDLCYTKEHLDTFVIASGDSDFAPLVSKLRENNKAVIGVGLHESTSPLLAENCDEFLYCEEMVAPPTPGPLARLPHGKREVFSRLVGTLLALQRESKDVLWSSLVKDTLKRKWPDFSESRYGYHTFSELLEEAEGLGLIDVARDMRSGGTYVVTSVHVQEGQAAARGKRSPDGTGEQGVRKAGPRKTSGGRGRAAGKSASKGGAAGKGTARKSTAGKGTARKRAAGKSTARSGSAGKGDGGRSG